MSKDLLRKLPSVDVLLKELVTEDDESFLPRSLLTELLREVLEEYRKDILQEKLKEFNKEDIINSVKEKVKKLYNRKLRKVVNGTGIVVHTNLGRALLSEKALEAVIDVGRNYSNLEYDLDQGERGSRYIHIMELIQRITGAEAALVVNNNAAAIMLVLNSLCKNKEAVVSRGQLVEIGGSFRVPEVMEVSGALLAEVGTTNKTHLYDYEGAVNENTGVLLKVHTSNFKIIGFTETVESDELVRLGEKFDIPVVEDIGSGVLIDFSKYGLGYESTVQECIKKGVDVVTFSGDKLLGGPQCGIIVGKKKYVDIMKKNQLLRALRVDKTCLAALEATLLQYLDESTAVKTIPTLNMLLSPIELHKKRAVKLRKKLVGVSDSFCIDIKKDFALVGGGAMPGERIESYVLCIKHKQLRASELEKLVRNFDTPIIVRVNNDEVLMDLRTIQDEDFELIYKAFCNIERKQQ